MDLGYSFVRATEIGRDPGTGADHYVVVGRNASGKTYATWLAVDWSNARNAANRSRGIVLSDGHYGFRSLETAREDASERGRENARRYDWVPIGAKASSKTGSSAKKASGRRRRWHTTAIATAPPGPWRTW